MITNWVQFLLYFFIQHHITDLKQLMLLLVSNKLSYLDNNQLFHHRIVPVSKRFSDFSAPSHNNYFVFLSPSHLSFQLYG